MDFSSDTSRGPDLPPMTANQTAALLRSGMAIAAELIGDSFSELSKTVVVELGSRWDFDQLAPLVQRLLSVRAADFRVSFLGRLKESQDDAYSQLVALTHASQFGNTGFPRLDADTLTLVDEVAVETSTVVERSSAKVAGLLEDLLSDLNIVVAYIAERPVVKSSENPLGPAVVVKALFQASEDQDLEPAARALLLASFERPLAQAIEPVVRSLLEHYARHGFNVRAVRKALAVRPASSAEARGPDTQMRGPDSQMRGPDSQMRGPDSQGRGFDTRAPGGPGYSGGGSHGAAPSSGGPMGYAAARAGVQGGPDVAGGAGGGGPVGTATAVLNQIVTRLQANSRGTRAPNLPPAGPPAQELMESVDELQRMGLDGGGRFAAQAAGSINTWRGELISRTDRTVDKLTIEIVGMLFDHVLADKQVPAEIKARISRLQFPVLKAALMDAAFFASSNHPARRLIDRIAGTSVGWEPYGDDNQRYLREVDRVVHEVLEKFESDVSVFERLYTEFDKFVSEVNPADNDPVARAKKALEAAEKTEILTINTTIQVRRAFERVDLEPYIRDFLLGPWVRVLVAATIRSEAQPGFVKSFRDVIHDLVWSVQPKASAEDRARLVKTIPNMVRVLRDGLNLINYSERDREVLFAQMMESHAMAVKPVDQASYLKASLATTELRSKLEGMQFSGIFPVTTVPGGIKVSTNAIMRAAEEHHAELAIPTAFTEVKGPLDPLEEARLTEEIARWQRGHWFKLWNGTEYVRARLRWMSPLRTLFLFASSQGAKPHALSAEQLRAYLAKGYIEPLEQMPLTKRAVDAVVADFEAEPERATELATRYAQPA